MYPLIRFTKELLKFRNAPKLGLLDSHISTHMCWPWDLDPWIELNNGRTLTLYDLGRLPMAARAGLVETMRARKWSITVAGNSVRYRRRIRAFHRFSMISRVIGWDHRFIYMEQSMWRNRECCNHMLLRSACTAGKGIVSPSEVVAAMGHDIESPELPDWVKAWIEADAQRPWPPVIPDDARRAIDES
ncbi:acyl-CoA thioesterase [Paracoccus aerodenitrificans]|uniref:acyl-CoA thioesterase n=1 Tax=Paracoccus aerodenitrificans TaxID=3017781 RepID=UPI0022F0BE44|nr:acyl-CoA thioesterase [Paracoccus aerodenitrificans]WBU63707.1 acyl-CoA thioesterase [Paracoccus aerodenitrificans]